MALTKIQKIGIVGGCIFVFSILFQSAILPAVVNLQVKHKLALKNGWFMREIWGKFPFVVEFRIYFFNVTNADGIKNGEKPIVQEIGPFVYDQWHEKTNQIDHDEDDTVSYTLRNTFYFNADKSNGLTGEEEIIVPNYFALGLVSAILREKPTAIPIIGKAIDSIFRKPENIFMKAKVRDILFDGLIIDCNVKDFAGSAVCTEIADNYNELNLKIVGENVYSMSLWGPMNGTDDKARTRVYRGIQNFMNVGTVVEYDNKLNISVWNYEYCDTFNGTDGTIFHPFFDKKGKDDLVVFNALLCRSISCYYDSRSTFAGFKTLRYTTNLGIDPENNPQHKCYCTAPDLCLRKGAYDLYKCLKAPIIVTNPHFYMSDPYYLNSVEGLSPNKEKHMLIVDLEPFTGAPLHAHTRVQFNMFIKSIQKFKLMKNFPDALLPLLWFDQIIILPDFFLKVIKNSLILYKLAKVFQYLMMLVALGMCGFAGFMHYKSVHIENKLKVTKTDQPKEDSNSDIGETNVPMNISTLQKTAVLPNID